MREDLPESGGQLIGKAKKKANPRFDFSIYFFGYVYDSSVSRLLLFAGETASFRR